MQHKSTTPLPRSVMNANIWVWSESASALQKEKNSFTSQTNEGGNLCVTKNEGRRHVHRLCDKSTPRKRAAATYSVSSSRAFRACYIPRYAPTPSVHIRVSPSHVNERNMHYHTYTRSLGRLITRLQYALTPMGRSLPPSSTHFFPPLTNPGLPLTHR